MEGRSKRFSFSLQSGLGESSFDIKRYIRQDKDSPNYTFNLLESIMFIDQCIASGQYNLFKVFKLAGYNFLFHGQHMPETYLKEDGKATNDRKYILDIIKKVNASLLKSKQREIPIVRKGTAIVIYDEPISFQTLKDQIFYQTNKYTNLLTELKGGVPERQNESYLDYIITRLMSTRGTSSTHKKLLDMLNIKKSLRIAISEIPSNLLLNTVFDLDQAFPENRKGNSNNLKTLRTFIENIKTYKIGISKVHINFCNTIETIFSEIKNKENFNDTMLLEEVKEFVDDCEHTESFYTGYFKVLEVDIPVNAVELDKRINRYKTPSSPTYNEIEHINNYLRSLHSLVLNITSEFLKNVDSRLYLQEEPKGLPTTHVGPRTGSTNRKTTARLPHSKSRARSHGASRSMSGANTSSRKQGSRSMPHMVQMDIHDMRSRGVFDDMLSKTKGLYDNDNESDEEEDEWSD